MVHHSKTALAMRPRNESDDALNTPPPSIHSTSLNSYPIEKPASIERRAQSLPMHMPSTSFRSDTNDVSMATSHNDNKKEDSRQSVGIRLSNGVVFKQNLQERGNLERKPMTPFNRLKTKSVRYLTTGTGNNSNSNSNINGSRKQFTVKKTVTKSITSTTTFLSQIRNCKLFLPNNPDDYEYAPSGLFIWYLNYTFRSSFFMVFSSFVVVFFVLVLVFGLLLKWAGEAQPQCIISNGEDFGNTINTTWADGFALSWTTFTTVGYGAVYTATGNNTADQYRCAWIIFLCTIESFIGLLYAGICTAIMFAKVGRIQSHAQVTFGDIVCVEYGKRQTNSATCMNNRGMLSDRGIISASGILSEICLESAPPKDDDNDNNNNNNDNNNDIIIPTKKGKGAASIHYTFKGKNSTSNTNTNKKEVYFKNDGMHASQTYDDDDSDDDSTLFESKKLFCPVLKFQLVNQLANQPSGEILDARINVMVRKEQESYPYEPIARFLRVELVEATHPFFNRIWHCRHILDGDSPLVSVDARKMIYDNNGYWPEQFNDPLSVREHLRFNSLIITMTGISNISSESVQIARRYYHSDVLIGYNFAPLLYKDDNGRLTVDMSLVNDVIEQEESNTTTTATTTTTADVLHQKQPSPVSSSSNNNNNNNNRTPPPAQHQLPPTVLEDRYSPNTTTTPRIRTIPEHWSHTQ